MVWWGPQKGWLSLVSFGVLRSMTIPQSDQTMKPENVEILYTPQKDCAAPESRVLIAR
jgi:hypothetical protein